MIEFLKTFLKHLGVEVEGGEGIFKFVCGHAGKEHVLNTLGEITSYTENFDWPIAFEDDNGINFDWHAGATFLDYFDFVDCGLVFVELFLDFVEDYF